MLKRLTDVILSFILFIIFLPMIIVIALIKIAQRADYFQTAKDGKERQNLLAV